jgi:phosphoribosyl-AMP cyclohydrolase
VVFKVEQLGPGACHTGHRSCFYRKVDGENLTEVETAVFDAEKVYQVKK